MNILQQSDSIFRTDHKIRTVGKLVWESSWMFGRIEYAWLTVIIKNSHRSHIIGEEYYIDPKGNDLQACLEVFVSFRDFIIQEGNIDRDGAQHLAEGQHNAKRFVVFASYNNKLPCMACQYC